MKNTFLSGLALVAMLFVACESDDTADIIINDNSITNNNTGGGNDGGAEDINLAGTYTEDLTLDPENTYTITGSMIMAPGTTLTIPAGTTVNALASGANVYLAISQGATIEANGTASNPVVFTSTASAPSAGDWGGLILLGRAPINSTDGTTTSTSEIANLPYGGTNAGDSSGTLRYVRVEYSGGAADGQSENNGFSFYGVGSGTVVEYIQAYIGADDGVEFFGGTVNASFVSVIGSEDDSIDYTEGWSGTLNDAYIRHQGSHDNGVEGDGYNTDVGNFSNPVFWSNPTINRMTIDGDGVGNGMRLRAGTQGSFNDIMIDNTNIGFRIDGDTGNNPTSAQVANDLLNVVDVTFTNLVTGTLDQNTNDPAWTEGDLITGVGNGAGTDFATWGAGWARQ